MNAPFPEPAHPADGDLLPPAVSPRSASGPAPLAGLTEPLPPFAPTAAGRAQPAPAAMPVAAAQPEVNDPSPEVDVQELLLEEEPAPAASAAGWEGWDDALPEEEREGAEPLESAGDDWLADALADAPPREEAGAADWGLDLRGETGYDPYTAPPEPEPAPEPAEPPAEPAGAALSPPVPQTTEPALAQVADRLEHIARALRDRSPAELLADSSDPLQILIAGYALGLAQARGTGSREARGTDNP